MGCITQCLICHVEIELVYSAPLSGGDYVCIPCARAYYAHKGRRDISFGIDYDLWPKSFREALLKICPQCRTVHQ
jgi:hypothetical protein